MSELITISVDLPVKAFEMLEVIASERNRRKDEIIREALELYISEWNDYKRAAERFGDISDGILSEQVFWAELKMDYGWKM